VLLFLAQPPSLTGGRRGLDAGDGSENAEKTRAVGPSIGSKAELMRRAAWCPATHSMGKGFVGPELRSPFGGEAAGPLQSGPSDRTCRVFFNFIFFENIFYRNIFSIEFCTPTALQGAAGGLPSGRRAARIYM